MNCPTRDPDPKGKLGNNQNPSWLDGDLVTNASMNDTGSFGSIHSKSKHSRGVLLNDDDEGSLSDSEDRRPRGIPLRTRSQDFSNDDDNDNVNDLDDHIPFLRPQPTSRQSSAASFSSEKIKDYFQGFKKVAIKYAKFFGPGIMVSVSYMDPGNYSTAVSAGALYQYKLLFVVLMSNFFAAFLQTLCLKLGSVTGMDLAENCREHLPVWLCYVIYALAEIAIIATDLAEVVGTAIALNILFNVPLSVGVALTVIDVLLVLMVYQPTGPLNIVRYFEYMVAILVFVVVVCFGIELGKISADVGEVLNGFLPSKDLVESSGLYLSCGILGATVMPHSLYLGSGLVQPRLRDYDTKHGYYEPQEESGDVLKYKPTIYAIKYAMNYSIAELIISLFTVAVFVNAAILIVAGATLSGNTDAANDADLFSIYEMLKDYLGPAAGTVFALALLFSGQSAGIVCTLAGQMVSEGFLHWSFQPYIRRLITRGLAIAPCFFVAIFVGRRGLADVLNASQVVLSLLLPFVSAPLLYFTASKKIMKVPMVSERLHDVDPSDTDTLAETQGYSATSVPPAYNDRSTSIDSEQSQESILISEYKDMSNGLWTNIAAVCIFCFVSGLNIFLIVSMCMGEDVHL
jgi:metal iron transporter